MNDDIEYVDTSDVDEWLEKESHDSFEVWKLKKEYLFWGICIVAVILGVIAS